MATPWYAVGTSGVTSNTTAMNAAAAGATWNLIDGYLYVGYLNSSGAWTNVTNEWLQLGFARGLLAPTAPGTNPINPNAILLLQEPADRNGDGKVDQTGKPPVCGTPCSTWTNPLPPEVQTDTGSNSPWFQLVTGTPSAQSVSMFNWYPINFYDAREGEPRDADAAAAGLPANSCTIQGVMNAVEIDVGNLNQWLLGKTGSSGSSVNYSNENGYILYFSDRRGMINNPYKGYIDGDAEMEDVINSSSSTGVPDGLLETTQAGHKYSPEDTNLNGKLDNYGTINVGLGMYNGTTNMNTQMINNGTPLNPYSPRITTCASTGRKNWVSGARHVLRLVDGALGNVPIVPSASCQTVSGVQYCGGFTVASENPVYIQGNYNSNSTDTFFTKATSAGAPGPDATSPIHAAASVIADAVTILSNNWNDEVSTVGDWNVDSDITQGSSTAGAASGNAVPKSVAGNRVATTTYYRVAVAAGKNMAFNYPAWETATDYGFGTDGGIHNFLRFLEDWGGQTLHYGGSLVSLYYANYGTGPFKCCEYSVYSPPVRDYYFDTDFTIPAGLPPGTPMFRDIESLGYRQMLTARTH